MFESMTGGMPHTEIRLGDQKFLLQLCERLSCCELQPLERKLVTVTEVDIAMTLMRKKPLWLPTSRLDMIYDLVAKHIKELGT